MQRILTSTVVLGLAFAATGCGKNDELLRTQGRLLKAGEDFIPAEGAFIQITFVPIPEDGKPATNYYYADVDQETGRFLPDGAQKKGMPPGRYRVAVELMKNKQDLLGGIYDAARSPYVFDVDAETEEIVIDLDKPPARAPAAVSALVVPMGD
jgi:hypothetical protein